MRQCAERTAIVTGASRGTGLAIEQRLVNDGARVVITGRRQEAVNDAVWAVGGPIRALAIAGRTRFAAALYEGRDEMVAATYPLHRLGVLDLRSTPALP